MTKTCSACRCDRSLEEFHRNKASRDGRCALCKECAKARARRWYGANRDRGLANVKQWQKANPGRRRKHRDRWRRENLEAVNDARRRLYARKGEEARRRQRLWRSANPDKVRVQKATRRATELAVQRVAFTEAELIARLSMFVGCWMCGREPTSVDHVKPLTAGGMHALANLRPACGSCNSRKRTSWPVPLAVPRHDPSRLP